MKLLAALLVLTSGQVEQDLGQTYLVSIVDVPLAASESLAAFSFSTWGVTFDAVCHLPSGWTIKAGSSLTPEGILEGEGSLGTSWLPEQARLNCTNSHW